MCPEKAVQAGKKSPVRTAQCSECESLQKMRQVHVCATCASFPYSEVVFKSKTAMTAGNLSIKIQMNFYRVISCKEYHGRYV